jgi:hypothetical protein
MTKRSRLGDNVVILCGASTLRAICANSALYLWRRSLVSTMIAHFVTDAVGFLVA